ncbi:MAG: glutamine amidotransferase [Leptolyngbyaceae cyanobacterium CAN_BIN12]|nr:glutamine amidotransferase [Leptolyngbyaceae cyanobacterium CAN_BIN12]
MPKLIVIKTGRTMPELQQRRGDFEDWMIEALAVCRSQVETVDVTVGERLPAFHQVSGIVITGSHAMVTEHHDWSEYSAEWIKVAADKQIPTLGICYGHQLIAYALGGSVDYMPDGREVGTLPVTLHPSAQEDELLHDLPEQILVQLSHRQAVMELPQDTVLLASSDRVPFEAFRYGDRVWGMQFHPEFSMDVMQAYTRYARSGLESEGFDPDHIYRQITDTPNGLTIMQRFAGLVF